MLTLAAILTKGGLIVWSHSFLSLANPSGVIESLVSGALIEGKPSGAKGYVLSKSEIQIRVKTKKTEESQENGNQTIAADSDIRFKWLFANDLGVIFIVGEPANFQVDYDDQLLLGLREMYVGVTEGASKDASGIPIKFDSIFGSDTEDPESFTAKFIRLLQDFEVQQSSKKKLPRKFHETDQFKSTLKGSLQNPQESKTSKENQLRSEQRDLEERMKKLGIAVPSGKKSKPSKSRSSSVTKQQKQKSKSNKEMRSWVGGVAIDGPQVLDYSASNNDDDDDDDEDADSEEANIKAQSKLRNLEGNARGKTNDDGHYDPLEFGATTEDELYPEDIDDEDVDDEDEGSTQAASSGFFASISNVLSFTQTRTLTREDLTPILDKIQEKLIQKNVAEEVSRHICEAVCDGLIGKKVAAFSTMTNAVKKEMATVIKRILTPKTSTDVLRDIHAAKKRGEPYTMAFIGVNGVGKSTNLSKICYWLLQNKMKLLVAACDTFRSGAVEQLKVHERNLTELIENSTIEVFDRGYGKDPAGIAKDAIGYAKNNDFDVVLIDTAGRMQDNEPLMRALAKLVSTNNPDKVIFVGEALVGNEAISQLTKFNLALKDFSGQTNPRQIDGMILTKFDTIDDKVGAALSMTYITGQPIFFVGTGQTYTDLRRLNVKSIVENLLK